MKRTLACCLLLLPIASAQSAPPPLDEVDLVPQQATLLELSPGDEATLILTATNHGTAPLNVTITGAAMLGPGAGGMRGPGGAEQQRPPPGDANATTSPTVVRPGGAAGGARPITVTLVGEPNRTLEPGVDVTIWFDIIVNGSAPPGDRQIVARVTEAATGRSADHTTTLRILPPPEPPAAEMPTPASPHEAPLPPPETDANDTPWPGAAAGLAALLAAARGRRRP